jgi:hypothetical protein
LPGRKARLFRRHYAVVVKNQTMDQGNLVRRIFAALGYSNPALRIDVMRGEKRVTKQSIKNCTFVTSRFAGYHPAMRLLFPFAALRKGQ